MIYAPHMLLLKSDGIEARDEFGRIVVGREVDATKSGLLTTSDGRTFLLVGDVDTSEWKPISLCRCDDNTTKEIRNENGEVFRPAYHVVCDGRLNIKAGDEVRCMIGKEIRGEGRVLIVKHTNYFGYTELWM